MIDKIKIDRQTVLMPQDNLVSWVMAMRLGRTQQAWQAWQAAWKCSSTNVSCTIGTWNQAAQLGHRLHPRSESWDYNQSTDMNC